MLTGACEAVRRHHFRLRHTCVLIVTLPFLSPFELTEMIFSSVFWGNTACCFAWRIRDDISVISEQHVCT